MPKDVRFELTAHNYPLKPQWKFVGHQFLPQPKLKKEIYCININGPNTHTLGKPDTKQNDMLEMEHHHNPCSLVQMQPPPNNKRN